MMKTKLAKEIEAIVKKVAKQYPLATLHLPEVQAKLKAKNQKWFKSLSKKFLR